VVFEGNRDRHLGEIFNVCVTEAANFGSSATPTVLLTQDEPQTPLCHIASF
jgi:hypothetical protein